jgi:hypothetical protein
MITEYRIQVRVLCENVVTKHTFSLIAAQFSHAMQIFIGSPFYENLTGDIVALNITRITDVPAVCKAGYKCINTVINDGEAVPCTD